MSDLDMYLRSRIERDHEFELARNESQASFDTDVARLRKIAEAKRIIGAISVPLQYDNDYSDF